MKITHSEKQMLLSKHTSEGGMRKTKSYVRSNLRRQRKAACWLSRNYDIKHSKPRTREQWYNYFNTPNNYVSN